LDHTLNASLGPCLDTPCAPGPDGVLGTADDPGIPNKTSFDAGTVKLHEEIATLDLSREFEVGLSSPLTLSFGGAYRRENYQILAGEPASYMQGYHPDQYGNIAAAGSQVFPGLRPQDAVDANRNNVAGYVELESDIAPKVLAQVAGRFEHYSDFGSQVTGKLALRYQPVKQWTFRGALSNGFRAPSLSQSYYSQIATNFEADPNTGKPVPFEVGIFPVNSPEARALGAKPLKAEKSVNVSAGLAFSPQQNITFTADYYFITLKDRIQLSTAIQGDSVAHILANIGSRATAAQYMTNAIDTHTQGVDVTANFAFDVGRGKLNINPAFNWTQNKVTSLAPVPAALDGTGVTTLFDPFYEGGLLSLTDERPKWRGTISANYALGAWSFMARSLSFGQYKSALYSYSGEDVQTYKGQTIFDAEVGYLFHGARVSLGARNLFDTYPGFMNPGNSFFIFPYPSASPYGFNGRYLYTRLELGVH
jgi:iron complex outermembrane recepter protein